MLNAVAVQAMDAPDDYVYSLADQTQPGYVRGATFSTVTVPQQFDTEVNSKGQLVILTNQVNAILRYQYMETDTTKYSALFTDALAWLLASYLAGAVIKGDHGMQVSMQMMKMFSASFGLAQNSDTNQRIVKPMHVPSWINAR